MTTITTDDGAAGVAVLASFVELELTRTNPHDERPNAYSAVMMTPGRARKLAAALLEAAAKAEGTL
jgi:hypothetical protein